MVQGRGQFLAAPADETGRLFQGDGRVLGHQGAGLGRGDSRHRHPARQDQGLGLGPALGQAPGHQQLVQAGFHDELMVFRLAKN